MTRSTLTLLVLLTTLTGCSKLTYIRQATAGQYDLYERARPIDDLIAERHVDAKMRTMLGHVGPVKRFGEANGLAATINYTRYVRLDRPYVVWVVSASDPLKFKSRSWSFPVVGSFTYLGWFRERDAHTFAAEVREDGLDVDVRGSPAYSTAGFFEDAVLSTMFRRGKAGLGDLMNTVLHEMTHSTFFVRDQSTLNESVAKFVGDALAARYLEQTLGADAPETRAYHNVNRIGRERGLKMHTAYRELERLYASKIPREEKLARKAQILADLRTSTRFTRTINNATLIQYKTYNSGQDELAQLLVTCGDSFPRLLQVLEQLETRDLGKKQEKEIGKFIRPLIDARCQLVAKAD